MRGENSSNLSSRTAGGVDLLSAASSMLMRTGAILSECAMWTRFLNAVLASAACSESSGRGSLTWWPLPSEARPLPLPEAPFRAPGMEGRPSWSRTGEASKSESSSSDSVRPSRPANGEGDRDVGWFFLDGVASGSSR